MGIYQRGFTIIEVMLFLAISAALAAALMGGWSLAVNTQSYKDSVVSLKTKLQEQYTNAVAVQNDRSGALSCNNSGGVVSISGTGSESARGASDCVVLGRYISADGASAGGGALTIEPILGDQPSNPPLAGSTIEQVFGAYNPTDLQRAMSTGGASESTSGLASETYTMPWNATFCIPQPNSSCSNAQFSMAIIQSPLTGVVYTYIDTSSSQETVQQLLTASARQTKLTLCVKPGSLAAMGTQAIVIASGASSQTGVSQLGDGENNGC